MMLPDQREILANLILHLQRYHIVQLGVLNRVSPYSLGQGEAKCGVKGK